MAFVTAVATVVGTLNLTVGIKNLADRQQDVKFWNTMNTAYSRLKSFIETAKPLRESFLEFVEYYKSHVEEAGWDITNDEIALSKLKRLRSLYATQSSNVSGYAHLEKYLGDHLVMLDGDLLEQFQKTVGGKGSLAWNALHYFRGVEHMINDDNFKNVDERNARGQIKVHLDLLTSDMMGENEHYLSIASLSKLEEAVDGFGRFILSKAPSARKLRVLAPEELGEIYGY